MVGSKGGAMRGWLAAILLISALSAPANANPPRLAPRLAVFDLELIDTSVEGDAKSPQAVQDRLIRAGDQLRRELAQSGKFEIVDTAPVNAAAHDSNLQACGGCDVRFAQQIGADLALTGVVRKISNLLLNISLFVRDVPSGRLVSAMNADLRGDTDESWSRATTYLVRNRLLAPNYGAPQPQ
jgi:Protein of unknown function (DUF2380)